MLVNHNPSCGGLTNLTLMLIVLVDHSDKFLVNIEKMN